MTTTTESGDEREDFPRETQRPARKRPASRRDNAIAAILLGLLTVGFLVTAWPQITGPIADSDDGINAAVWGYNSRSLRENGIVDSRFGGLRIDGTKYATHPPLIVAEAALVERIVGEHPWSTRAAAWLGSLASIVLIFFILRAIGIGPAVAAAATVAAMANHMLFVYGSMLDTMVTSFPFALAIALVWYRQWTGRTVPHPAILFFLAAAASLGGWQATLLVTLCGIATLSRVRHDRRALARAFPYLFGAAIGVALTLAWAYWVYGSFSVLNDRLSRRTSGEGVTILSMVDFQIPWLAQLLGLGFIAWIACAVSLRDRRFRPIAALGFASVITYALFLKEGSGGHQYWNYWSLLPAAIGFGYAFERVTAALAPRFRRRPLVAVGAVLAATALIVAINVTRPNQAGDLIEAGYRPFELVTAASLEPGQRELTYVAEPYRIDEWVRYHGSPRVRPLLNAGDLRALAREHPDDQVLVLGSCANPDTTRMCDLLTFGSSPHPTSVPPRFLSAAQLSARLPPP